MTRYLCPDCQVLLYDELRCEFCGGYYKWIEGGEKGKLSFDKWINKKGEEKEDDKHN